MVLLWSHDLSQNYKVLIILLPIEFDYNSQRFVAKRRVVLAQCRKVSLRGIKKCLQLGKDLAAINLEEILGTSDERFSTIFSTPNFDKFAYQKSIGRHDRGV